MHNRFESNCRARFDDVFAPFRRQSCGEAWQRRKKYGTQEVVSKSAAASGSAPKILSILQNGWAAGRRIPVEKAPPFAFPA
jgi:hypothetical protein